MRNRAALAQVQVMPLVTIETKDGFVAAVDEAGKVIVPQLDPLLKDFASYLAAELRGILVGRTITIRIE
jgi:hypothetical protein